MDEHPEGRLIKYTLRIREKLRDQLAAKAEAEHRSLNNQIVHELEVATGHGVPRTTAQKVERGD